MYVTSISQVMTNLQDVCMISESAKCGGSEREMIDMFKLAKR